MHWQKEFMRWVRAEAPQVINEIAKEGCPTEFGDRLRDRFRGWLILHRERLGMPEGVLEDVTDELLADGVDGIGPMGESEPASKPAPARKRRTRSR